MAFPYYPASYGNPYQPQMTQGYNQSLNNGIIWVQGIEAMKSYPISAGQSVLLMDSETNCFGIKTADASGMPLPLRIFDYTERTPQNAHKAAPESNKEPMIDVSGFVTREEFEARIAQILAEYESKANRQHNNNNAQKGGQNNGK